MGEVSYVDDGAVPRVDGDVRALHLVLPVERHLAAEDLRGSLYQRYRSAESSAIHERGTIMEGENRK
jgi:hypothetical protein